MTLINLSRLTCTMQLRQQVPAIGMSKLLLHRTSIVVCIYVTKYLCVTKISAGATEPERQVLEPGPDQA
jgi:hypothetical protein